MAKKTVGHIELQWTCPNCGGINPGSAEKCQACGAPQPADVQFEQTERQELITDEEKIKDAISGADIHCPYCGTRNPAKATTCSHCGGDLVEGLQRESGRVVGAFQTGPQVQVPCPRCGAENPDTAKTCTQCGAPMQAEIEQPLSSPKVPPSPASSRRWIIIGAAVIAIVALCALLYFLFFSTDEVTGTVQAVQWERAIPVEAFGPVEYKAFIDEIPNDADVITCTEEYHHTQTEPVDNSIEVCGTPYTVDTGGGFAEVVQDCEYEVYLDFCEYTVDEWYIVDTVTSRGNDFNTSWPNKALADGQRLGEERSENYVIIFDTKDGTERYTTTSYDLFQEAQIGTKWVLKINQIGGVQSIER